jgi:hypothetical protein
MIADILNLRACQVSTINFMRYTVMLTGHDPAVDSEGTSQNTLCGDLAAHNLIKYKRFYLIPLLPANSALILT